MEFEVPSCIYGREHEFAFRQRPTSAGGGQIAVCQLCFYTPHKPPRKKASTRRPKSLKRQAEVLLRSVVPVCAYCAVRLTDENRSVDHVVPRFRGGPDHISNYVLSCKECNQEKGDQTILEWLGVYEPPFLIYKPMNEKWTQWKSL